MIVNPDSGFVYRYAELVSVMRVSIANMDQFMIESERSSDQARIRKLGTLSRSSIGQRWDFKSSASAISLRVAVSGCSLGWIRFPDEFISTRVLTMSMQSRQD